MIGAGEQDSWLVGRSDELLQIFNALERGTILTLLGPGGVGKTALARAVRERFSGSCFWADLSHARLESDVRSSLLRSLGSASPGDAYLKLRGQICLLVADGGDFLERECGRALLELSEHLDVRVILTSRRALGAPGERIVSVGPLGTKRESSGEAAAVRLLRRHVTVARRGTWRPTESEELRLEELACLTDGLPLAIEVIGARAAASSLGELLTEIRSNADQGATTWGSESIYARSIAAISDEQRWALRSLTLFPDTFDAAASNAVGVPRGTLNSLVNFSLVFAEHSGPTIRYRLLDPIREAVVRLIGEVSMDEDAAARMASHFAAVVGPTTTHPWDERLLDAVEISVDRANYEAALDYLLKHGMRWQACVILRALCTEAFFFGSPGEAFSRLESSAQGARCGSPAWPALLRSLGAVAAKSGAYEASQKLLDEALGCTDEESENPLWLSIVWAKAQVSAVAKTPMPDSEILQRALERVRSTGHVIGPLLVFAAGANALVAGDFTKASNLFEEGSAFDRALGRVGGSNDFGLAEVAFHEGDLPLAVSLLKKMLNLHHIKGLELGTSLTGLAACAAKSGCPEDAIAFATYAEAISGRTGIPPSHYLLDWRHWTETSAHLLGSRSTSIRRKAERETLDQAVEHALLWDLPAGESQLAKRLRRCEFFAPLSPNTLTGILAHLEMLRLTGSRTVIAAEEPSDGALRVLLEGRLARTSRNGVETLLPGDAIWDGVFLKGRPFGAYVEADPDARLAVVSSAALEELPEFRVRVEELIAARAATGDTGGALSIEDRLLQFVRSRRTSGSGSVHMPFTQAELAARLGVARETIARALGRLEDRDLIRRVTRTRWTVA